MLTVDQVIEWRAADGLLYHARVVQPIMGGTLKAMCLHSGRILELNSEAVIGVCQDYKG